MDVEVEQMGMISKIHPRVFGGVNGYVGLRSCSICGSLMEWDNVWSCPNCKVKGEIKNE